MPDALRCAARSATEAGQKGLALPGLHSVWHGVVSILDAAYRGETGQRRVYPEELVPIGALPPDVSVGLRRGANLATYTKMTPESAAATKAVEKAVGSEVLSEIRPIKVGEKASPSRWMIKTFTARAVERIRALTEFTSAALLGPVPIRIKNTAAKIAGNMSGPVV